MQVFEFEVEPMGEPGAGADPQPVIDVTASAVASVQRIAVWSGLFLLSGAFWAWALGALK